MKGSVAYDHRYGRVRIKNLDCGVSAASYSGMVDMEGFEALRKTALKISMRKSVLIIDTSKVITTVDLTQEFIPNPDALTRLPAVVICRADQLVPWQRYAEKLGRFGVLRVVFLDSERDQALNLAQTLALAVRPQESN